MEGRPGPGPSNMALARRLIPPEGNNWGEIASHEGAEAEFMARVGPLIDERYETIWRHSPTGSVASAGLAATMDALRQIGRGFDRLIALPELFVDLGDRVLVLVRREGRTAEGVDFTEDGAALYVFEDGRLRRMELYTDRSVAFADAGITAAEAAARGVPSGDLASG